MNKYEKKVKKSNLYKEFVSILNGKLQLSQRETDLLSLLVKIDSEWAPRYSGEEKNILSTDNRRFIMKETRINKSNLSKYINILRDKGILLIENGKYVISPFLSPIIDKDRVTVIFNLVIDENNRS